MRNFYLDDALTFTNHAMWAARINAEQKFESNNRAQTTTAKRLDSTPQEADVRVKRRYFEKKQQGRENPGRETKVQRLGLRHKSKTHNQGSKTQSRSKQAGRQNAGKAKACIAQG